VSRYTSCGKPGCRCQGDPPQRHGPYYQWSRALSGKTVSRRLNETDANLYRTWTVESAWSAVLVLPRVRFSRPLAEPGVPITGHRALHGCCRRVVLRLLPRGWESCCLGSGTG